MDGPGWRVGSRFGPYELRSLLGKGGMGEVYEAYDTVKDRVVAVKLLPEEFSKDPVYQVRFRRESQAAARLAEPHIIPIHDWGSIDGVLFIDMRLVSGVDLRTILRSQGPMTPERTLGIIDQIAAALDAAHANGLVHRDVKPANILIADADFAYLADFGIAHTEGDSTVTQVGMAVGSYIYMAPERFDVGPVTGRADIYSLTCVLYECLTGATPFPAASMNVLIRSHLTEPAPRPSAQRPGIPPALDEVIAKGMAKDPADRYPTAAALAQAARVAASTGPVTPAPTFVVRTPDPSRFGQQSQPAPLSSLVPPEATGELSIIPTAATAVPSEIQFEPLPPRREQDPAPYGPEQSYEAPVPVRPFPDAHLFGQEQGGAAEPPQYPAPPTQRYAPVPAVSGPPVAMSPQGSSPQGSHQGHNGPPQGSFAPPTQRYDQVVPEPYGPAAQPYGDVTPAPGAFAPATQRYDGAAPAGPYAPPTQQYGDAAPISGSQAEETRHYGFGAPGFDDPASRDGFAYESDPHVAATRHYGAAQQPVPGDPQYPAAGGYPAAQAYSDYQPDSPGHLYAAGGYHPQGANDPRGEYGYGAQGESGYGAAGYAPPGDGGYGAPGHYDDYSTGGYLQEAPRRSIVLPMLVAVVVIVVLAVGGVIGWSMYGSGKQDAGVDDQAGAITTSAVARSTAPGAVAPSATTSAATTSTTLPAGAKTCTTGRPPSGSFGRAAAGSEVTSCPFAEAVRQAYAESAAATSSRAPRSIVAVSPVTGRSYTMNCVPEGQLVTCTGGENAVVYIY